MEGHGRGRWLITMSTVSAKPACARCARPANACSLELDASTRPTLKKCSRCKFAKYCSVACQRADWPDHRAMCRRLSGIPSPPPESGAATEEEADPPPPSPSPLGKKLADARRKFLGWLETPFHFETLTLVANRAAAGAGNTKKDSSAAAMAFHIRIDAAEAWAIGTIESSPGEDYAELGETKVWVVATVLGEPMIRFGVPRLEPDDCRRRLSKLAAEAERMTRMAPSPGDSAKATCRSQMRPRTRTRNGIAAIEMSMCTTLAECVLGGGE